MQVVSCGNINFEAKNQKQKKAPKKLENEIRITKSGTFLKSYTYVLIMLYSF